MVSDKNDRSENSSSEDYYLTPEGFRVFTEKYHLKRGYCCKSGCRHCPYGYDIKSGRFIKKESKNG